MSKYRLRSGGSYGGINSGNVRNAAGPSGKQLNFFKLYDSSLVGISDYRCCACRSGPAAEEISEANNIVLMRRGAFSKHFGRRSVTADVNQAVFFSKGSTYRVSHPGDCGDRGTVFSVSQQVLCDIIREFDPSIDDHPEKPFPFIIGPCDSGIFLRHHDLVRKLEAAQPGLTEPLQVDEMTLELTAKVFESAFKSIDMQHRDRRNGTGAIHMDRAEAVKEYLAARLGERIILNDVSLAVNTSPFHLTRLFKRHAGIPVHRYLTLLRLRTSLERLAEGEKNITDLAIDLGFYSHSHFTDVFRREFGFAPSKIRQNVSIQTLREMSKNMEV